MATTVKRAATKKTTGKRPTAKKGVFNAPKSSGPKVAVRTPNKPGSSQQVDGAKYAAMRKVLHQVMPKKAPGYTQTEMMAAVGKVAPKDVFPGHTYHWWAKCVELDLETKGELARETTTPLRWHLA
jgi:hypothetical protein